MYTLNDVFIQRATGRRVKLVETKRTQEMSEVVTRYRMSGDQRFLTAQQLRQEYGAELGQPQPATAAQGR